MPPACPGDSRFHNLRHTFGTTVIRNADAREVMEWMGHADLATTRRYLAFIDHTPTPRSGSAKHFGLAETVDQIPAETSTSGAPI